MQSGGWWHNPSILSATGEGIEKEEPRAWEGNWNENVVELVRLSMRDGNALCVLLTGRREAGFATLLGRMVAAKKLEFDMMCLKPTSTPTGEVFDSTMTFKQALLRNIVFTYSQAEELRIYEDRPKHVKAFEEYFAELNQTLMAQMSTGTQSRAPFRTEVVFVNEQDRSLHPDAEVSEVQKMINTNNKAVLNGTAPPGTKSYRIKRSVFYTGYLLAPPDVERLRSLIRPALDPLPGETRYLANNVLITPRPAPQSILNKVGGLGAKMAWRVIALGQFDDKVWAARVEPAVPGTPFFTDNKTPCVVLALRKTAKPIDANRIRDWQTVPAAQALVFETTVGEKVLLRVEPEVEGEEGNAARASLKHPREEDFPPLGSKPNGSKQQQRGAPGKAWGNRGGGGGGYAQRGGGSAPSGPRGGRDFRNRRNDAGRGGGGGGGGGRGGGAGGAGGGRNRGAYRSLDDNVGQGYGSGGMQY